MSLRFRAARALEQGRFRGPVARALGGIYATRAQPVRPLRLPPGSRVIGVGGATLGGSGKTPVVHALAERLSVEHAVVIVAHGYRAEPGPARVVRPDDRVSVVGDEALMLARALPHVPTVVARDREDALALAATLGDLVIVDGLLQTRPEPLALSLLVVESAAPWGSGCCPPAGDLRASKARLLAACDAVVSVGGPCDVERPCFVVGSMIDGAITEHGERLTPEELRGVPLGLSVAIARPERVIAELRRLGVEPVRTLFAADHDAARIPAPDPAVRAWLTTAKCATKWGEQGGNSAIWRLSRRVVLPEALVRLVAGQARQKSARAVVGSAACFSGAPSPT